MSDDGHGEREREHEDDRPQTEATMTEQPTTDTDPTEDRTDDRTDDGSDLRRTLNYVLLGGLALLGLIATIQLYLNVSSAINQWITYEYRSLFQAAFNLVVLLLVGVGMLWQVQRLRD
ncbi:hypothetical protein JCM30237_02080 [Halolamina litorea]|uniref:DUF8060 domain-containing protein n=1 Tax=Halolamina litorea TaxID=1515593 RepID=A0ABD6BTF8_9EURY|nr:hypothetical protein [Halolamina litorea]